MTSKNIPGDIKSKSLKETREEIDRILEKFEKNNLNLEEQSMDYERLLKLNRHIDELFKSKFKEINSLGKNVKK